MTAPQPPPQVKNRRRVRKVLSSYIVHRPETQKLYLEQALDCGHLIEGKVYRTGEIMQRRLCIVCSHNASMDA